MPTVFSEIKMTQLPYLCLVFSVLYQPLTPQYNILTANSY